MTGKRAEIYGLFGEIIWLLDRTPGYRDAAVRDVCAMFLPPAELDQLRLYRRGPRPVALGVWAWLDPDAAARHVETGAPLRPEDWRSGDALWFIDVVAPFGDGLAVGRDLLRMIPPGGEAFGVRHRGPDGRGRVVTYRPAVGRRR